MKKLVLALLVMPLFVAAGCDDDGGGDNAADSAVGNDGAATGTGDAATVSADTAVANNPDSAAAVDAAGSKADAAMAGPVNAPCSALPVTLRRTFNAGFRYDYGVICYNPAGLASAVDCRIREGLFQQPSAAGCVFGGVMIAEFGPGAGAVGGTSNFFFGFGTVIASASAGTVSDMNILAIPDGPVTVDFQGGFNTSATVAGVHRLVMTYNTDNTVTVTSIGPKP